MGYFAGLTDSIFKKDKEGNTVFYPYGVLGPGYVIKSQARAKEVRSYVLGANVIGVGGVISAHVFSGTMAIMLFLFVFIVGYVFLAHELTKDLDKSAESLSFKDSLRNSAQSYGKLTVTILATISICFVVIGFMMLSSKMLLGVACIAFFGLATCMTLYMLLLLMK